MLADFTVTHKAEPKYIQLSMILGFLVLLILLFTGGQIKKHPSVYAQILTESITEVKWKGF